MDAEDLKVFAALRRLSGMSDEVYRARTYVAYRRLKQVGIGNQKITLQIFDAGPDAPNLLIRFHCVATTNDDKSATGNGAQTLEQALSNVHWRDLGE